MRTIVVGSILTLTAFWLSPSQKVSEKAIGTALVAPGTPYSPGVLVGDTLYISGLQGTDSKTHQLPAEFGQELKNCLENVGTVLKDSEMDYSNVVSVQIFLQDMNDFKEVNSAYTKYFKSPFPARTTVQVSKLSLGARIEIAAVAHR
jgi:2-iminobutanoate/2-iminopropanoate deaminase